MGRAGTAVTARTGAAPTVALVVPAQPEGALSCWRRVITAAKPGGRSTYALDGPWLNPGTGYEITEGALVLLCDRYADRRTVRLARAATAELADIKTWELKSPLGKRVVDFVARRLPADAAAHTAARLEPEANRRPGRCARCRRPVAARAGILIRDHATVLVAHRTGQCPPPPDVVRPNRGAGPCHRCGGWVERGEGAARLTPAAPGAAPGKPSYRPFHEGDDCARSLPGPRNRDGGWCGTCGELVPPGEGYWLDRQLHHAGPCPRPTAPGPTWVVRRRYGDPPAQPGDVLRIRVDTRRRGHDIPLTAPGYRMLDEAGYAEMIGVVLETVQHGYKVRVRVRPATAGEAAPILAAEEPQLAAAAPHPGGFPARFGAEAFGRLAALPGIGRGAGVPWVAEITGRDPDYVYRRDFLRPDRDYTNANSKLTRGVKFWWTLLPNRVYEAQYWTSWQMQHRVFLRVTPAGDVAQITKEEVDACLNVAAQWPAQ